MHRERRKEWPVLVVVTAILLILAPPALYLSGYFWLPEVEEGYWVPDRIPVVHRTYRAEWLAKIYEPAGSIEERITNREVEIGCDSP
jgi:hypothetical protein